MVALSIIVWRYGQRTTALVPQATGEQPFSASNKMLLIPWGQQQRQDSIAAFEAGGRDELAAQERGELLVISAFMPATLDEAETRAAVAAAVAETGAAGPKDMGRVVAALKAKHAGRIDMGRASGLVKEALAKLD